jgi:hypothetical protein
MVDKKSALLAISLPLLSWRARGLGEGVVPMLNSVGKSDDLSTNSTPIN